MIDLSGKVALVTGATRGIGASILKTLGLSGAFVVGTATSEQGVEQISHMLETSNISGIGYVLDVTSQASIDALMHYLESLDKLPQILVNNAGITADDLLLRMDDEAWDKIIQTNLSSVFRMTRACIKPMFRKRFGRIITIGSVVGSSGNAGQSNYTAAKAGVIGFTKSVAQEMGSRGITANVVAPGFIETDMTEKLPTDIKDEMLKRIPLRKMGQGDDIANAVVFLASDLAGYITGETLHVNGGMYMG